MGTALPSTQIVCRSLRRGGIDQHLGTGRVRACDVVAECTVTSVQLPTRVLRVALR